MATRFSRQSINSDSFCDSIISSTADLPESSSKKVEHLHVSLGSPFLYHFCLFFVYLFNLTHNGKYGHDDQRDVAVTSTENMCDCFDFRYQAGLRDLKKMR